MRLHWHLLPSLENLVTLWTLFLLHPNSLYSSSTQTTIFPSTPGRSWSSSAIWNIRVLVVMSCCSYCGRFQSTMSPPLWPSRTPCPSSWSGIWRSRAGQTAAWSPSGWPARRRAAGCNERWGRVEPNSQAAPHTSNVQQIPRIVSYLAVFFFNFYAWDILYGCFLFQSRAELECCEELDSQMDNGRVLVDAHM